MIQILPEEAVTVAAGAQVIIAMYNNVAATVAVFPATGATALVEFSLSAKSDIQGGSANWIAWTEGTVSSTTVDSFASKVAAIRVTATGGTVVVEVQK